MDLTRSSIRWIWHPRVSGLSSFPLSMKRRNAILLGLAFLLMMAGYVAWCWRAFYLPTPVRYTDTPSEEVIGLIRRWQEERPLGAPISFDPEHAIWLLGKPWRPYRQPMEVQVTRLGSGDMECQIWSGGESCIISQDRYLKRNGKWINENDLPEFETPVFPHLPPAP